VRERWFLEALRKKEDLDHLCFKRREKGGFSGPQRPRKILHPERSNRGRGWEYGRPLKRLAGRKLIVWASI